MVISTSGKKVSMKPGYAMTTSRRASILYHSMEGDRTFFLCMDVFADGAPVWNTSSVQAVDWAIEGFSMKNRHDTVRTGDVRETVIGTNLTA
jgi:hypothetical protein